MNIVVTYFHGSSRLFKAFDLTHATEGDGKVKFGYGVYLTSAYSSAAHYSNCGTGRNAEAHYVYSVEVPKITQGQYLSYIEPVHEDIIAAAEKVLGYAIPQSVLTNGKDFRKWLAKSLIGEKKVSWDGEKAAAKFLDKIGVIGTIWPYNWKNPNGGMNVAIFNVNNIKITKIESIEVDNKGKFVLGSNKEVGL